ncbi:MAG: hypothetical protein WA414_14000, partial [Acidobacteriaceae bacterium]
SRCSRVFLLGTFAGAILANSAAQLAPEVLLLRQTCGKSRETYAIGMPIAQHEAEDDLRRSA